MSLATALRYLFTAILVVLAPILILRVWMKCRVSGAGDISIKGLLGRVDSPDNKAYIWVHAVSVGEAQAARPIIDGLLVKYPDSPLWVTSTTLTGYQTIKRLYQGRQRVRQSLFPLDLPWIWSAFFKVLRPKIILIMETEIWPNLFAKAGKDKVPLFLVNARLSDSSVASYRRIRALVSATLANTAGIFARSAMDYQHFVDLGAPTDAGCLVVTGNLKWHGVDSRLAEPSISVVGSGPVWIAASTHEGEEAVLLKAQQHFWQSHNLRLVLVPRHPERFDTVAQAITDSGLPFVRYSSSGLLKEDRAVMLLDAMGELESNYFISTFAFIGGSLMPVGGHNPIEALRAGIPVLTGPHTENFTDVYPDLFQEQLAWQVTTVEELIEMATKLMTHNHQSFADQASEYLQTKQKGLDLILDRIELTLQQ